MEEKYGEKLKKAAEKWVLITSTGWFYPGNHWASDHREGVQDIEELKKKVLQPKIDAAKEAARFAEEKIKAEKQLKEDPVEKKVVAERKKKEKREVSQAEGDKSGIKVGCFPHKIIYNVCWL